jgi:MerR family transcriptional regulator, light-induced transcriptional regulator
MPAAHPLMPRYLAAQLAGNQREALRLVMEEGLGAGMSAREVHLSVVAEAQRELGRLWEQNRITVADEHQATAISQLVLSHLYTSMERDEHVGKTIVVACVEGELHDMAARIAADMLESAGFDVVFLGANVPTWSLVHKLRAVNADALALAVTMSFHLDAVRKAIAKVRESLGDALPIFVGGEAVADAPELADGERVHVSRGSALDLVATARRALGVTSLPPAREAAFT